MSRLSIHDADVVNEVVGIVLDNGLAAVKLIAVPSSQTSGLIVVTWTTGDPAVVGDGARIVANGAAVTIAENYHGFEELRDHQALMVADYAAVHAALTAFVATGAAKVTLADLTSRADVLTTTYTAGDPTYTANDAVTIADGAVVDDEEVDEMIFEIAADQQQARDDLGRLHSAVQNVITNGVQNAEILAARTSNNGSVAITYTANDPVYTPDGSFTVSDGALMPAPDASSYYEELINDCDFLGDDFTLCKASYDLYIAAAGRPTA
jgi:hypothetical protein